MARGFQFKNVRSRFVFLFSLVGLIPLVIVSVLVYWQRVQSLKNNAFTKLTAIRDLKVEQVNAWLAERSGDIRMAAEDYEIRQAADAFYRQTTARLDRGEIQDAREFLKRYVQFYESFYDLFIIDTGSGKIVISSDPSREGNNAVEDTYFTVPLQTKTLYIKDIYYSKTIKKPSMTFSYPIFSLEEADKIVGVAVARINLERSLYGLLLLHTGLGTTGETLIVNKDAIALNELRWYPGAPLNLKITAKPSTAAANGETGIVEATDYRGVKVLAAYTHIPGTGWGFVAKQDQKEVYASIAQLMRTLLVIIVIVVVIIFFIAVFTANAISRPILEMAGVSRKIREGNLSARNISRQKDELGFLAQVFNEMADSLQSQMQVQQKSAEIIAVMVEFKTLETFSYHILKKFLEVTGSHFGVFYTLDREKKIYKCAAAIGANIESMESFKAEMPGGEIAAALADREISHIANISPDTVFQFKIFLGTAVPKDILTIPVLIDEEAAAVIALASLMPYTKESLEISRQVWLPLNTAFANLLAGINTAKLAEDLQQKNTEITLINEELKNQAEELKMQRLQVAEADRLKSEFLSNMSHELRTPLNSILALSRLMISKGTGGNPGKDKENLTVIERNGRILLDLINGILDLAKIEAGRVDINLTDFKPEQVITAAMEVIRPTAESKGLNLVTNIENNPDMYSDRARVQQILFNLLANAVKFTKKGEIGITVTSPPVPGNMIFFTVRDTGLGIKSSAIPYIFDEFRQGDGSFTREYEGAGLGLAISRKFARLLGGDITVESEWGKGSVFTLALPLSRREKKKTLIDEGEESQPQEADWEAIPGEAPRILIIEDNEVAVMQIKSLLEDSGYTVFTAANGTEGLDMIDKILPHAVILDLMMPKIDGFQVLEQIRSTLGIAQIPVLVLTAKELTPAEEARLKRNNIRQLIRKGSVDRDQLRHSIEKLLKRKERITRLTPASSSRGKPAACQPILVVEDNPDNRYIITSILDGTDYPYLTAENGEEAVSKAKTSLPALILMDIQLPLLSGLDAAKQIKMETKLADVPIIALTGRAMKGDKEKILLAGCDDYISKPFHPKNLLEVIKKWLD